MQSWEESEDPIEEEAIEIGTKDVDKNSSDKPETLIEWEIVSEKWLKKSLHVLHDEKASCVDKTALALSCKKENARANRYDKHKNPRRKYCICH